MRLQDAEEAVLTALEHELLDPEILKAAVAHAESALARLTQAVAEGGAIPTLLQAIRDQERRHQTIRAELADMDRPRMVPLQVSQLKALLRAKAEEWQSLLRKRAPIARQMVRKLIEGRIVFTPEREARRYTFRATGTLANFFSGIVCPPAMASPTGSVREWTRPVPGRSARCGKSRVGRETMAMLSWSTWLSVVDARTGAALAASAARPLRG